jgi:hypothetical protein
VLDTVASAFGSLGFQAFHGKFEAEMMKIMGMMS